MNILVADGDRHFLELLRGIIEQEGHTVTVADAVDRALSLLTPGRFHLLVVDAGLRDDGATRLVHQAQGMRMGRPPEVVLLSAADEAERRRVQVLVAECDVRRVLRRPFPMFDLVDLVRALDQELVGEVVDDQPSVGSATDEVPRGAWDRSAGALDRLSEVQLPQATTYLGLPLVLPNLQRISRLWAKRASGVLRLDAGPSQARGWMLLGEGGPLDSAGWELVSAALHGGRLEFEARQVPGAGDHLGLGAMVFGRARDPEQRSYLRQVGMQALHRVRAAAPLDVLPLSPATRTLLAQAQPGLPLGELAARLGLDGEEIGPDLHAVDLMGLVLLGEPMLPRRSPAEDEPGRPRRTAVDRRQALRPASASPPPAAPAPPADDPPSQPTDIRPGGLRAQREHGDEEWPRLRRRLAERGRSWAARLAAQQGEQERDQRVGRMRKDLDRVEGQPAAVVLGIPARSDAALVQESAARLRARYDGLAQDPAAPGEERRLAQRMVTIVDQAEARMLAGGPGVELEQAPEEERLLALAEKLVAQDRWEDALRALRRARDLRIDHPGVLSLLGMATLHDPAMDPEEREEEAFGFMMLAVQFAPQDGPCNLRLARHLLEHGEPTEALEPARRAVAAMPGDPAAAAVLARALAATQG
ncbi:hypothetical protein L6R53_05600 [Myxococcota bacterium]|nr:hypothetical protein [Myxococcota bacterium]